MMAKGIRWGELLFLLFIAFGISAKLWNWEAIQERDRAKAKAAFNEKLLIGRICPEDEELKYQVDATCARVMREYFRKQK